MKILFIGPHRPNRNGSQRFRMEQYFAYLEKEGFACDYSWFINENDDYILYKQGHWLGKSRLLMKAILIRLRDLLRANSYDIIFVQREAFIMGTTFFEKQFARSKAKLVFDFDDAIWLEDTSDANQKLKWLKSPSKTAKIIKLADLVIAGNDYLAAYALQYNANTHVIPTVVDTNEYFPTHKSFRNELCIGWIGSSTTIKYYKMVLPALKALKEEFGNLIFFKQVSDQQLQFPDLDIENCSWNNNTEVADLNTFDIGLIPLPDDEWSKGKCGFKAIQYMALRIPPVASPVGVNTEIISQGETGFLASNMREWIEYLSLLIKSQELREKIGSGARNIVFQKYSVQKHLPVISSLLKSLIN